MPTPTELWEQLRASRDVHRLLIFADSFPGTIEGYQARELAAALEEYVALWKMYWKVSMPELREASLNAAKAIRTAQLAPLDPSSAQESIAAQQRELTNARNTLANHEWAECAGSLRRFLNRWPNHPDAPSISGEARELEDAKQLQLQLKRQLECVPPLQGALPDMIKIPAGQFLMGSAGNDEYYREFGEDQQTDSVPQHEVRIGYTFEIGKFPVTFAQWDAARTGSWLCDADDMGWGRDKRPAINVSYYDAQAFCDVLNKKLKLSERADRYRLPSEAEWEYACRAGATTRYSFGDDERLLDQHAWWSGNADGQTHPVGSKRPNPFCLYDMHGLVYEWCADDYHRTYDGAPTDGSAWMTPHDDKLTAKIIRGGAWVSGGYDFDDVTDSSWNLRTASRAGSMGKSRRIGFRVARTCVEL